MRRPLKFDEIAKCYSRLTRSVKEVLRIRHIFEAFSEYVNFKKDAILQFFNELSGCQILHT